MKIESIETFTREPVSLVRVRTNDGAEGWGQVSPFHADITATVLHRQIAPVALGADAEDLEGLSTRCIEANYKFPWSYVCRALTGVDTALWDLKGKRAGASVAELLGAEATRVRAYGSSMRRNITPAEEAERLVRLRGERGFGAFKIRIGKVCGHDQDERPGRTEELVPTVRKAIGDDVKLLVDANSCYTPRKAIQVGRMLEDNGVCHLEEPCPYWELEWTAEVAATLSVPVAGGEQDNDLAQWRRMIAMRAVDIVQPDVCYVGGLTRALKVAAMAAEAGLPCVPHSANLSLVSIFTLHLLAAIPNAGDHMEFSIEPNDWAGRMYQPVPEVRDGFVAVPTGPGWGVKINQDWLAAAERQVSG
ncbi:MAG TPA: mandelate racemase/muconate lactonizing enzyme family protein [Phycisphaerae bacterium]|nr:mandelate racemase/muconate lactonizing enzyme family protein [Phycisphaerae bacterium]HUU23422.1 mandelate racemase/muconate lactonizing enzyme family protein [Phycisphaerae bacterium]